MELLLFEEAVAIPVIVPCLILLSCSIIAANTTRMAPLWTAVATLLNTLQDLTSNVIMGLRRVQE